MIDVDFQQTPIEVGETRVMRVVSGVAPFTISVRCFVSDPPPMGLRPCEQCPERTVAVNEPFEITAEKKFWSKNAGGFLIDITDSSGARRRIHINVRPPVRGPFYVRA